MSEALTGANHTPGDATKGEFAEIQGCLPIIYWVAWRNRKDGYEPTIALDTQV